MKRARLFIIGLVLSCLTVMAQEIVTNPERPSNAKAGRIVRLKEEMRIADTGEGFYFKSPRAIRVSRRGEVFVCDGTDQALQFDAQGRFVRNFFKKGQGPGELTVLLDIWASPDRLYLLGFPPKVIIFNYDGSLDKEVSVRDVSMNSQFIASDADRILISRTGRPDPAAGSGLRDFPRDIVEISTRDGALTNIGSFPIRTLIQLYPSGAYGMTAWNSLQAVPLDGRTLVLNYTFEYRVEIYDREIRALMRRFNRPYVRVKGEGQGGISGPGGNIPSGPEFQRDINALHVVDGKIWVQTSTVAEGKGILFDVFDREGRYVDCFYIQSTRKDSSGKPANQWLIMANGFAYAKEGNEDELIVIKKYRLVGL